MSKPFLDRRWPWVVATFVVVLGFLSTVLEVRFGTDVDQRPIGSAGDIERLAEREDLNVLFILIDTLRADHLGSYGYERDTSPELDRLAAGGVRFDRHMSQSSWTKSSMASLWTGLYPARTGITRYDHIVPDQAEMPAETFQQAGFRTVGLYRNGWVAPTFGFGQGFDVYIRPASGAVRRSIRVENQTLVSKSTDEDAVALRNQGILYAPDVIANAGGLIHLAGLYLGMTETELDQKVDEIEGLLESGTLLAEATP